MLKQALHKTGSIILAFIVLFSSFSFTVHEHICGGEVADTSFYLEADSCGMETNVCENDASRAQNVKQEPCCSDNSQFIQGNHNNQQAQQSLEIAQVQFITVFVISYISLFKEANIAPLYNEYSPPLVVKNIHKLDETYLI